MDPMMQLTTRGRPHRRSADRASQIPRPRCDQLLRDHHIGRVAWLAPDGPQLLPVSYLVQHGNIVVRTSPYGVLAGLRSATEAAFEVDEINDALGTGWSVLVRGRAQAVVDETELTELWTRDDVVPWAPGTRNVFISIVPRTVTGRTFALA